MRIEVKMPQMGESLSEGTLVKWYKNVGDAVRRDEPLFEISTDKVDTEVPSPGDGYVSQVLVDEGQTVAVNTVVCYLAEHPAEGHTPPAARAGADPKATQDEPRAVTATQEPAAADGAPADGAPADGAPADGAPADDPSTRATRLREKSSPWVRRLAAEHGIDLTRVEASGTGGRVTKEDLLRHINTLQGTTATRQPSPGDPGDRVEPLSVMRRAIAAHMLRSLRTAAHAATIFEVDMTGVRRLRGRLAPQYAREHATKLTYLPFVLSAVARSLREFPSLNTSIEGESVRYHARVHLGVAVALRDGLIVPVIRDANGKNLLELARDLQDLAQRARDKQLLPEEVQGGTFTVTNPGVFGSLVGTPILPQPQTGILCLGAIEKRPVVLPETDAIAVRSMAYLSLTFDHRLIDGAVADHFMANIRDILEGDSFEDKSPPNADKEARGGS